MWRDQACVNTLWFEKDTPYDADQLQDLVNELYTNWQSELKPLLSDDIALAGMRATAQDSSTAPSFATSFSPALTGDVVSDTGPNNSCWTIQFATAQRGRSFRGRNYIGGIPLSVVAGNYITVAAAGAFVGAYTNLVDFGVLDLGIHVVVSHFTNGGPRVSGVTTPVISYRYADLAMDSQRRRLPGRGS